LFLDLFTRRHEVFNYYSFKDTAEQTGFMNIPVYT